MGFEANPEKIESIMDMTSPNTEKEIQRLIGRIVVLKCLCQNLSTDASHSLRL